MSLPSLATVDDIAELAPDITADADQAGRLLVLASAIVREEANRTWVSDEGDVLEGVPDGIPELVALMVIRALRVPEGVTQETIGNYSVSYAAAATDRLYLTKTEKAFIKRTVSGPTGAFSISTHGAVGYLGIEEDVDWTL